MSPPLRRRLTSKDLERDVAISELESEDSLQDFYLADLGLGRWTVSRLFRAPSLSLHLFVAECKERLNAPTL